MEKRKFKARAVVEVEVETDAAMAAHAASRAVSETLYALEPLTGGRVKLVDYHGVRAVADEKTLVPGYVSDLDRPAPEGIDTAALSGAFDYLFTVIDELDHNAHARRELTAIKKAVLS